MTQEVRYPEITVELIGGDGNAFAILGAVSGVLRRAGVPQAERDEFMAEATSGDYDHLLATCMAWVTVTGEDEYEDKDEYDPNEAEAERLADEAVETALVLKVRYEAEDRRWAGPRPLGATRMFEWEADRAENEAHDRR